jgi:6-phosphogluconolactonase
MRIALNLLALLLLLSPIIHSVAAEREWTVFLGTYTRESSKGIYAFRFDGATGKLTSLGLAIETSNPSFLALHPNKRFLYAVGEGNAGTVSAFSIEPGGKLKQINTVSARGSDPCHLAFDKSGNWLFVANYTSGSIASFPVRKDGSLGEAAGFVQHAGSSVNRQRQEGPHAHSVNISPDNRFLIVNDLGLDQTLVYRLDAKKGALTPHTPSFWKAAPGSGPRHLTFSADGKFAWVLGEMSGTVTALSYNKTTGTFAEVQTLSTLPSDFTGPKSGAEIEVHPNGRFLYTSNRGHDSIAIFDVDPKKGVLKPNAWVPTRGKTPRHFAIDPSGGFLLAANQDSNSVAVFRIDPTSGGLTPAGEIADTPVPVSIVFAPGR